MLDVTGSGSDQFGVSASAAPRALRLPPGPDPPPPPARLAAHPPARPLARPAPLRPAHPALHCRARMRRRDRG